MRSISLLKCLLFFCCGVFQTSDCQAETIYFLVGESCAPAHHNDSYVLPLSEASDIAHARDLIANGPGIGGAIVVASMRADSNGLNRNYGNPVHGTLNPAAPEWS